MREPRSPTGPLLLLATGDTMAHRAGLPPDKARVALMAALGGGGGVAAATAWFTAWAKTSLDD